ncbi:MAG: hypothetical protein M3081_11180 [Gemmatimonadota bacterium]|nr:hypothetical protein [Gemmatimonadota bacterium]
MAFGGSLMQRHVRATANMAFIATLGAADCAPKPAEQIAPSRTSPPRAYWLGFSAVPPRADIKQAIRSIDMWTKRSDAAIMHIDPPWAQLLAGVAPEQDILKDKQGLANYFRARGTRLLVITVDPENGLARERESDVLIAAHRSITEPAVQTLYRRYVAAVDRMLHPDFLGLAAEVNLIRLAAPRPVYDAVRTMSNDAAAEARARHTSATLYVSTQVEVAAGRMGGGRVVPGVADDLRDFPFTEVLALSSYPYLGGFAEPEQIPLDYYAKLARESGKRVLVVEGGWPSSSASAVGMTVRSNDAMQARYLARHFQIADAANALALFQLEFADVDLASLPGNIPGKNNPIMPLFTSIGLVTSDLVPKPALSVWDSAFARRRSR